MTVQVAVWPRGIQRTVSSGPLARDWDTESARVGKPVFMSQVGTLGSVTVSTRYEQGFGGTDLLSWTITPLGGFIGGMFRPGDHCRITQGGGIVGEGELSEVIPSADGTVEFQARGYGYNLGEYDSVIYDASAIIPSAGGIAVPPTDLSYPSTVLTVGAPPDRGGYEYAVDILGMPIAQVVGAQTDWNKSLSSSRIAQSPWKVGQVVTERELRNGRRWAVWGRTLVLAEDPTTAKWKIDAPDGLIGTADTDEYATDVGIWYVWWAPPDWTSGDPYLTGNLVAYLGKWYRAIVDTTGTGTPPPDDTATWEERAPEILDWMTNTAWSTPTTDEVNRFDTRTVVVDYRGAGTMSSTAAQQLAQSLADQVKGQFILNGSITVAPDGDLKSAGGGRAPVPFVRAGDGLKLNKLRTTQGNLMPDFVVIGKTEWRWSSDGGEQLQITPMGAVPRDFGSILTGSPYSAPSDSAVA